MRVKQLVGIERKDTPIAYRRTFTAQALMEGVATDADSKRVEFILEQSPLGDVSVRVRFLDDIDYPLIPAVTALKEHISELDRDGKLP